MKIGSKLEHTYALCNCFADTRKLIKSSVVNSMLMLMNCNTEASARVTQSRWSVRSGGKKGVALSQSTFFAAALHAAAYFSAKVHMSVALSVETRR